MHATHARKCMDVSQSLFMASSTSPFGNTAMCAGAELRQRSLCTQSYALDRSPFRATMREATASARQRCPQAVSVSHASAICCLPIRRDLRIACPAAICPANIRASRCSPSSSPLCVFSCHSSLKSHVRATHCDSGYRDESPVKKSSMAELASAQVAMDLRLVSSESGGGVMYFAS